MLIVYIFLKNWRKSVCRLRRTVNFQHVLKMTHVKWNPFWPDTLPVYLATSLTHCKFSFSKVPILWQILAYLLLSSSSSAATRIDDWILNWGKDDFTKTASSSIVISFLAFLCFAFSSLISGYNLCDQNRIWSFMLVTGKFKEVNCKKSVQTIG